MLSICFQFDLHRRQQRPRKIQRSPRGTQFDYNRRQNARSACAPDGQQTRPTE